MKKLGYLVESNFWFQDVRLRIEVKLNYCKLYSIDAPLIKINYKNVINSKKKIAVNNYS